MHEKAKLRGMPVPSEARDLRYRILRSFRRHLPSESSEEVDDLVEVVQGVGLRLNLRGTALVFDSRVDAPYEGASTNRAVATGARSSRRPGGTLRRRSLDGAPASTTA